MTHTCVSQAWAFTTQARKFLGKVKHMNMLAFDHGIWKLHRRLFHRFLKYKRFILRATEDLPEFNDPPDSEGGHVIDVTDDAHSVVVPNSTICLLTSDSDVGNGDPESDAESA